MHADSARWNDLSGQMIGCAFTVLNTPGAGFLEKVCENALAFEVRAAGLSVAQQCSARMNHRDVVVGDYFVDLLVEDVLPGCAAVRGPAAGRQFTERKLHQRTNRHMPPGIFYRGVGCNAAITSKRSPC